MKNLLKVSILGILVCCFANCIYYQRYPMAKKRLFKLNDQKLAFYLIDPSRPLSGMWYVQSYDFRQKDMTLKMVRISEREAITVTNIGSKQDARMSKNDVLMYIKPQEARGFTDSLTTKLTYDQLERVEVYEVNYGKSIGMSFVGYVTVGLVLSALITGGFCQPVYAVNPADGPLQGELFAGAAWQSAVRTEHLYLPDIQPRNDTYTIRLGGKNGQMQHVDEIGLYALEHPVGTQVIVDHQGKPHIISNPVMPLQAIDNQAHDIVPIVSAPDDHFWPASQETAEDQKTQTIELVFPKPAGVNSARLHIKAKNSLWLDAVFNEYRTMFPNALPPPNSKREETESWLQKQHIPLAVSLYNQHKKWQHIGQFYPNGTLKMRDDVLEIDLTQHKGDQIHIKLECGFQFWEMDYVAMDYSVPTPIMKKTLAPKHPFNTALKAADGDMLTLNDFNEDVLLSFYASSPCREGMKQSFFVCGTGFYTFSSLKDKVKSPGKMKNLAEYSYSKWKAYCKTKI